MVMFVQKLSTTRFSAFASASSSSPAELFLFVVLTLIISSTTGFITGADGLAITRQHQPLMSSNEEDFFNNNNNGPSAVDSGEEGGVLVAPLAAHQQLLVGAPSVGGNPGGYVWGPQGFGLADPYAFGQLNLLEFGGPMMKRAPSGGSSSSTASRLAKLRSQAARGFGR